MTLTNYWWLLIWMFAAGGIIAWALPKQPVMVMENENIAGPCHPLSFLYCHILFGLVIERGLAIQRPIGKHFENPHPRYRKFLRLYQMRPKTKASLF